VEPALICTMLAHLKKILFICPYPYQWAPSQRFRYEQYLDQLTAQGYQFEIKPFLTTGAYLTIYQSGNFFTKIITITYSYLKRFLLLSNVSKFDLIFIHREIMPAGPPVIEWLIAKVFKKKIIYDFDDAIWLTDKLNESFLEKTVRWRSKVSAICKWSYKVSCGNSYLADYARQFNNQVIIDPTTIDTEKAHNPKLFNTKTDGTLIIGWTGSHSTLKYLEKIESTLKQIENKYPSVVFLIIADRPPNLKLKNLLFKKWSQENEVKDLMMADIGIMPLPDDDWTRGKCGFKALQYMALEIPAVVSPVGVNIEIVEDGTNGYSCSSEDEWFSKIERLILNHEERVKMGKRGREKVIQHYSVFSNSSNFLSLFQ
jgi:glycosyltransferase involved in cell wall biosynthesis